MRRKRKANGGGGYPVPKHFDAKQRVAFDDLLESTATSLHTTDNRFTYEMAATLMAKFRTGSSMTATEMKELKRQLAVLGLAKDDDGSSRKNRKNSKYFGPQVTNQ